MRRVFSMVWLTCGVSALIAATGALAAEVMPSQTSRAEKARLDVACIERINSEGESESVILFYHPDSATVARGHFAAGRLTDLVIDARCGVELTLIRIFHLTPLNSPWLLEEIERAGGFKKATVVFF